MYPAGKGENGEGEGNKSITPHNPLPASPSHCALCLRQNFPVPPTARRDATGFVATGCLVPSPLPDPSSNVLVARKNLHVRVDRWGFVQWEVEGAQKANRISSWHCYHFLFTITARPGLQPEPGCWLFTAVYTGCLISRELYRCTRARSLSWDHFAGRKVVRSGPLNKKPRKCLSPPNPGHVQPPATMGMKGKMWC